MHKGKRFFILQTKISEKKNTKLNIYSLFFFFFYPLGSLKSCQIRLHCLKVLLPKTQTMTNIKREVDKVQIDVATNWVYFITSREEQPQCFTRTAGRFAQTLFLCHFCLSPSVPV